MDSVITRVVTVAGGRFAPGHLGELTRIVPFEMVDAALAVTGSVQRRVRDLPSRVVVYLVLAGALFADLGYGQVWARMTAGLAGLDLPVPTAAGMAAARRRIGIAPLRALFGLLAGPAAGVAVKGVRWRGRLVTAVDGNGNGQSVGDAIVDQERHRGGQLQHLPQHHLGRLLRRAGC